MLFCPSSSTSSALWGTLSESDIFEKLAELTSADPDPSGVAGCVDGVDDCGGEDVCLELA